MVIGSRDPNPKVAGKGVQMLREAGVTVVEDFMREECDQLNPVFFHYITMKTPYVVMKYACLLYTSLLCKLEKEIFQCVLLASHALQTNPVLNDGF